MLGIIGYLSIFETSPNPDYAVKNWSTERHSLQKQLSTLFRTLLVGSERLKIFLLRWPQVAIALGQLLSDPFSMFCAAPSHESIYPRHYSFNSLPAWESSHVYKGRSSILVTFIVTARFNFGLLSSRPGISTLFGHNSHPSAKTKVLWAKDDLRSSYSKARHVYDNQLGWSFHLCVAIVLQLSHLLSQLRSLLRRFWNVLIHSEWRQEQWSNPSKGKFGCCWVSSR